MPIDTYIAVLYAADADVAAGGGEPVLCARLPDGQPKPAIDHRGVIYHLVGGAEGVFDYRQARDA